jgi:hypothetical protein
LQFKQLKKIRLKKVHLSGRPVSVCVTARIRYPLLTRPEWKSPVGTGGGGGRLHLILSNDRLLQGICVIHSYTVYVQYLTVVGR